MRVAIVNPTIGADVEMFFQHKDGEIVSAEGFVKGEKHKPFVFDPANKFFSTSLDNVLAEFTIPPSTSIEEWLHNLKKSADYINSIAPPECRAVALPAANLHPRFLQTENAQLFGCDSDFNVWERCINPRPNAEDVTLRSAGGHIHVGWENPSDGFDECEAVVKAMDLFLGVPSVLQEPNNKRKELYGKAGAFRKKDYGVEYRTISNYYMNSDHLMQWAYNNTIDAIDFVNNNDVDFLDDYKEAIVMAINENNAVIAQNLINQFNIKTA